MSSMVIVCTQSELLPQASVAVQVLVMMLSSGQVPGALTSLSVMTGLGSQLSVAVATPVFAELGSSSHSMVTSAGQVICGGVVSSMVMVCTQSELLPQASVAVQVRVMTLSSGQVPGALTSDSVIVGLGSQLSVAVAVPVFAELGSASHSMVTSAGQVI